MFNNKIDKVVKNIVLYYYELIC